MGTVKAGRPAKVAQLTVRMLVTIVAPNFRCAPGEVVKLPAPVAQEYLSSGEAEPVQADRETRQPANPGKEAI